MGGSEGLQHAEQGGPAGVFDTESNPITDKNGVSVYRYEYDADGNIIMERWFDTNGDPFEKKDGTCGYRKTYNNMKKAIRTEYLDAEGERKERTDGCAVDVNDYDDRGNLIYEANFNEDEEQVAVAKGCFKYADSENKG